MRGISRHPARHTCTQKPYANQGARHGIQRITAWKQRASATYTCRAEQLVCARSAGRAFALPPSPKPTIDSSPVAAVWAGGPRTGPGIRPRRRRGAVVAVGVAAFAAVAARRPCHRTASFCYSIYSSCWCSVPSCSCCPLHLPLAGSPAGDPHPSSYAAASSLLRRHRPGLARKRAAPRAKKAAWLGRKPSFSAFGFSGIGLAVPQRTTAHRYAHRWRHTSLSRAAPGSPHTHPTSGHQ